MSFFDFNNAAEQSSFDLIPKGTLVKVCMTIKPGGYDDPSQGWTGGFATRNANTGSVYLNCEFVVLEGEYARRKMWSLIGLHSPKGPEWTNMGRTFIKAILNSARGIHPGDNSQAAQNARRIASFADLEAIEFLGKVDLEKDQNGEDRSVIRSAITPEHKDYAALMRGDMPLATPAAPNTTLTPAGQSSAPNRPSWAQ
jgi:hypothetical protein